MKIVQATAEHLVPVAELFNQYRMFYEQPDDLAGATAFIQGNIENARSQVFVLFDASGRAAAFSQLYPTYCSTEMRPIMYLSDLFVDPTQRRKGYARALMAFLIEHFGRQAMHRLTLETATTNVGAQKLYESLGYQRDQVFVTYHRVL
ncbi:GNAT family N-acetyltransferase [Hydrogenophaga palleronii]|uniref:GNAT family N-acetyltransferase n=1 Tax=Hydrogenophaga palleronii TaxID=65655 RepID=UPI0008246CCF|nr:GNAT family N-acetyltransferase [Hydrogenophaga palleronii]